MAVSRKIDNREASFDGVGIFVICCNFLFYGIRHRILIFFSQVIIPPCGSLRRCRIRRRHCQWSAHRTQTPPHPSNTRRRSPLTAFPRQTARRGAGSVPPANGTAQALLPYAVCCLVKVPVPTALLSASHLKVTPEWSLPVGLVTVKLVLTVLVSSLFAVSAAFTAFSGVGFVGGTASGRLTGAE